MVIERRCYVMTKMVREVIPYIIILVVVLLIRSYVITPVQVVGSSMSYTLSNNEVLLLNKLDYRFGKISRYDIVVLDTNKNNRKERLIKRVIGLPSEHIAYRYGKLYVNDEEVDDSFASITNNFDLKELGYDVIPSGYYFVMGDNRNDSSDSRVLGLIPISDIKGSVGIRIWPLNKMGLIK